MSPAPISLVIQTQASKVLMTDGEEQQKNRAPEAGGVFMRQLINTLVSISPAGFEILTAGKQKPALWILQVSDYLCVFISLRLIQQHGGFGGAGLCVYTPEHPGFHLSEDLSSSEPGYDLFDCKIDLCLKSGRVFWASRLAEIHKSAKHSDICV